MGKVPISTQLCKMAKSRHWPKKNFLLQNFYIYSDSKWSETWRKHETGVTKIPSDLAVFSENAKSADVADSLDPHFFSVQAISTIFCRLPQRATPNNILKTGSSYVQPIRCIRRRKRQRARFCKITILCHVGKAIAFLS